MLLLVPILLGAALAFGSTASVADQPPLAAAAAESEDGGNKRKDAQKRKWRRLKTVRKLDGNFSLKPGERRRGRRLIARDESLAPLLRDAGGYSIDRLGPVTPGERAYSLIGVFGDIRLDKPITGTYRLPSACVDLEGEFIPLAPTKLELEGVDELMVSVSFDERRVFEAMPGISTSGSYRFLGKPKPFPWSCRMAGLRDRGR